MRPCLALVVALSLAVAARGEEPVPTPKSPMPTVVYATASEKEGKVTVKVVQLVQKAEQFKYKVKEGDQEVERVATRIVTVPVEQVYEVDGKKVTASRVNGKAIEPKDLVKLLEKRTAVLFVHHGKIDPFYEPVYKPDTIVIAQQVQVEPSPK